MLMNESVVTPEGITFEVNSQSQELIIKELITRKDGVNFTSFQTIQIFE
jgi:hypothetical protein